MNVWVQWASNGSPENTAAMSAASGDTSRTLHPRYASHMSRARPSKIPMRPMVRFLPQLPNDRNEDQAAAAGFSISDATTGTASRHCRGSRNSHVTSTKGAVSAGMANGVNATFKADWAITVNTVARAV